MTPKIEKKMTKKNTNKEKITNKKETESNSKNTSIKEETLEKSSDLVKKNKLRKTKKKVKKTQPAENPNVPHIIPKSYPENLIILVKNLPDKWKQKDIISAFTRFGSLTYVQKLSDKSVLIGFLELEGVEAVRQARKVFVRGQKVTVGAKKSQSKNKNIVDKQNSNQNTDEFLQRTVLVFFNDSTTTEDDIKEHFKSCGEMESLKLLKSKLNSRFSITFKKSSSAAAALKLHNSILKENNIHVRRKSDEPLPWDFKRTIVLLNPSGLTKIEGSKVTEIFEDCGEIEKCDVFCYKNKLAMLCFKHEDSIQKALRLNGATKNGLKIEIELYSAKIQKQAIPVRSSNETLTNLLKKCKKSKVCVEKVAEGLTDQDLRNLFQTCGPVKSVSLSDDRSAVVEFETVDGYCKAFSLHERVLGGRKLNLKPYSEQEMPSVEKKMSPKSKRNLATNSQPPKKLRKKA